MTLVLDVLSWFCFVAGGGLCIVGGIGLIRLPDLFTRMHAAGVIDTLGMALVMVGLMIQGGLTLVTVKLVIVVVFMLFTSPTATHALAKAALHGGMKPLAESSPKAVTSGTEMPSPSLSDREREPSKT